MKIIIFVLLYCFALSKANATPPSIPQKVEVSNPEKYLNIVLESEFIKSIENWELVSAEHPFYLEGKDSLVYVNLKYHYLQTVNGKEFVFNTNIFIYVLNDLISDRTLLRLKNNYLKTNQNISIAIQNPTVLFFVRVKEISEADANADAVSFNTGKKDLLSYHFQQEYPITLWWKSPELVDSLLGYFPLSNQKIEVYKEFQMNIGIDIVRYDGVRGGELEFITEKTYKEKCSGKFTFFPDSTISYSLPSSFHWETIPYIEKIREFVEENILIDSLSNFYLGSARFKCWFDAIMLKPHFSYSHYGKSREENYYEVFIRINPKTKGRSRAITLDFYPDGTFKSLKIK